MSIVYNTNIQHKSAGKLLHGLLPVILLAILTVFVWGVTILKYVEPDLTWDHFRLWVHASVLSYEDKQYIIDYVRKDKNNDGLVLSPYELALLNDEVDNLENYSREVPKRGYISFLSFNSAYITEDRIVCVYEVTHSDDKEYKCYSAYNVYVFDSGDIVNNLRESFDGFAHSKESLEDCLFHCEKELGPMIKLPW